MHNSLINSYEELFNLMKKKGYNEILYNLFMDNNIIDIDYTYLDIFLILYGKNEETTMDFINIAQKYAEKNNCKIFNKIINLTSEENIDDLVKCHAVKIIGVILNNVKPDVQYKLLIQFSIIGIFKHLNILINYKDESIKLQVDILFISIKNIITNADKNDIYYKDLNKKFKIVENNKKFYDKIYDDFEIMDY